MVGTGLLDNLLSRLDDAGLQLAGESGFLSKTIKAAVKSSLAAELGHQMGYDKRARPTTAARSPTTIARRSQPTSATVVLHGPRDRVGTFEPRLVTKDRRRVGWTR